MKSSYSWPWDWLLISWLVSETLKGICFNWKTNEQLYPSCLVQSIILCLLISSLSEYLFTSLPGTWARSVTYRLSWKKLQRRSRRSRKRYSTRKYSEAVQLPAGNLPAASTLLPDWTQAFFKGFLWLLWPKKLGFCGNLSKLQCNLHVNSRNLWKCTVKEENCSFASLISHLQEG